MRVICLFFMFLFSCLYAEEVTPFALITIPKSGSHLTIKALHLMTRGVSLWHTRFPSSHYIAPKEGFLYTHFCLSPQLEEDYSYLPGLKKIINIRDLRDVCVSMVRHVIKNLWPGMSEETRAAFKEWPLDQQLLFIINYEYEVLVGASSSLQVSLSRIAEQSIRYSRDPNNLVCRYENLVGLEGGGSKEAQVEELKKIAAYLQMSEISALALEEIADQLYGDRYDPFGKKGFKNFKSTFDQGSIGGWRAVFKEEHKAAFKEKYGEALIALGYEQDLNW